jgi:glycosyltransferase involved in cell wall biosynthesis
MIAVKETKERAIHVGVDAHLLSLAESYRSAGINWYVYNLLENLPDVDPEIEYTVFLGERRYAGRPGLRLRLSRLGTHRPWVRILWEQTIQPRVLRETGVNLLHGPAFVGPLFSRCPFVVTVHDLSFVLFPRGFRLGNRSYLRLFTRLSLQKARRVIAVSGSTRDDLVRLYGLPPERIDVVYNGVDSAFRPLPPAQVADFRARHGLPERFMLFVGTLEPRKNVAGLVEAYACLPRTRPPLMLVGGKGWLYDEVFRQIQERGLAGEIHFVGYVPAEELPSWYNAADLFVYPSFYEGFGLPVLEAMACGTPVITSRASSLPEVVGQAALLVDPGDVDALTGALERLLDDGALCEQMRDAGLKQAQRFSWPETARCTVQAYRRALLSGGGDERV